MKHIVFLKSGNNFFFKLKADIWPLRIMDKDWKAVLRREYGNGRVGSEKEREGTLIINRPCQSYDTGK